VIGGKLDQDDLDAIGVLDPHFGQAPGLGGGFPDDGDCGRGQPGVLGVDIPYLRPDHHLLGVAENRADPAGRSTQITQLWASLLRHETTAAPVPQIASDIERFSS
jgi:hypothetical protein